MSGTDGVGLCSYDELREYLQRRGEEHLLKYVCANGGRYELARDEFQRINPPSLKYQVAVVFMLLGEYTIAEPIHSPGWNDLSSWGDKVGNDLLKHFMKSFPQQA